MPVRYLHQSDEDAPGQLPIRFDDDAHWWTGVFRAAATVALAAALTVAATSVTQASAVRSFHQDDPAGSLFGQFDEDYWQNSVVPVAAAEKVVLPLGDPEELPAGQFYQADEEYWQNPVLLVPALFGKLLLPDPEELPAGSLVSVTNLEDEDLWQSGVTPLSPVLGRLYLPDPEETPAGALIGAPDIDEDFKFNSSPTIPPVVASFFQKLPYLPDPEELVAGSLSGQPDEDPWQNPAAPLVATFGKLYLPDPEELPAGSFYQADEDYWQNPVAPLAVTLVWPQQALFDVQEPSGVLFGQADEDLWKNPVVPVTATLGWLYLPEPEELPAGFLIQPAEYYWQNPVLPVAATLGKLWLPDPEEIPIGSFTRQIDEDIWRNPVVPVVNVNWPQLPYLPDPELLPAGVLVGPPLTVEDLWKNPVPPVPLVLGRLYLPDPEELPAGSFLGPVLQPDEDLWQNPVVPVAATFGKLYLPEPEELNAGSLFGQEDEDFWQNQVPPVVTFNWQFLPYSSDASDAVPTGLVQVSGNLKTILGVADGSGTVRFTLFNPGGAEVVFQVLGQNVILPLTVDIGVAPDGSFNVALEGNDIITPAGTLYEVTYYVPNGAVGPVHYSFTGQAVDLNTQAAI